MRYQYRIVQDEEPQNPREWDTFGKMICWHSRYNLGDVPGLSKQAALDLVADAGAALTLPLYLLDHSGLWMNITGFRYVDPQGWDSGLVGYAVVALEDVRREYRVKRVTKRVRALAEALLEQEVQQYNQYLTGDCWGYIIEDEQGREVESCWGCYGREWAEQQAQEELAGMLKGIEELHAEEAASCVN